MRHCRCRGKFWVLAAVVGGLYWLGKREQRPTREPSLAAIDRQELVDAWSMVAKWPQFKLLRAILTCQSLRGFSQARVLDVGSGLGQLSIEMAQRPETAEVTGIDLSGDLVAAAREKAELLGANARFLQADAAELPFSDASFDVVVSTLSLHHWEHPQAALREIYRVLAPGGRAVIVDLRRNAFPVALGMITLVSRYVVPASLRETGEPLASFHASFTPTEAIVLAVHAGWPNPNMITGPFWMALTIEKGLAENGERTWEAEK